MTDAEAADAKRDLRALVADRVRAVRRFARAVRAERLAATAIRAPALAGAKLVLCYRAMPDEIDVDPLVAELASRGVRVAFPFVTDRGAMWLYAVDSPDPLAACFWVRDRHGIAAPNREAPGVVRVFARDIDAAVVPGRAFDARGARLGRGKGHYDRLVARLRPDARRSTVGVCFREQLVDCVPEAPHDRRVACVAAEGRLLAARRVQRA